VGWHGGIDPTGTDSVVCNINVNGSAYSGSCRVAADSSGKTDVTYNVKEATHDGYGRSYVSEHTYHNSFNGSVTREGLVSGLLEAIGTRPQISTLIDRDISGFVGQDVRSLRARSTTAASIPAALPPASSPIWRNLSPFRGGIKTDGDNYYTYDRRHGEIEVFNKRGDHLGTKNAVTGAWEKAPNPGRRLDL
jgi:hypothetical protein